MPSVWIEKRSRKRSCTYRVVWQANGVRHSQRCGPSKRYAEEFKVKKESELWSGELGIKGEPSKRTWQDFAKQYLEYCRAHKARNTVNNFDGPAVDSFSRKAGKTPLLSISPNLVEQWKMELLKELSPNTVRMRLRALRAAFSYARRLKLILENPAASIQMPAAVEVGRILSEVEIHKLIQEVPSVVRRAVIVSLHTGLRRGEILHLDWRMVRRPDDRSWEIVMQRSGAVGVESGFQTKTRQARVIPLHPLAQETLGQPHQTGKVFEGLTVDVLESHLRKACKKLKLGRVRFHDLRHTWATRFMEQTGDLFGLMRLGGWRSINSVLQYQHLTRGRQEAILSLDFGITSPTVPPKMVSDRILEAGIYGKNHWENKVNS